MNFVIWRPKTFGNCHFAAKRQLERGGVLDVLGEFGRIEFHRSSSAFEDASRRGVGCGLAGSERAVPTANVTG